MIGHAIEAIVFAMLSMLVIVSSSLLRPTHATCPPGWYVEGVRPSGATQCRPAPPQRCGEPVPPDNAPCPPDARAIRIEIHCTNGQLPIVIGSRTVGCQQRH